MFSIFSNSIKSPTRKKKTIENRQSYTIKYILFCYRPSKPSCKINSFPSPSVFGYFQPDRFLVYHFYIFLRTQSFRLWRVLLFPYRCFYQISLLKIDLSSLKFEPTDQSEKGKYSISLVYLIQLSITLL